MHLNSIAALAALGMVVFAHCSLASERDQIFSDISGLELRNRPIDPSERTLVIFHAGQSHRVNIIPSLYIPRHSRRIDNFNIGDSRLYEIKGPMLGASFADPPKWPGNVSARIDDLIIERGIADRVISVTIAVGGSSILEWSQGRLSDRLPAAVKLLASRGIVPSPHVAFIVDWSQGPSDTRNKTTGEVWKAEFIRLVAATEAAGFSGRWVVSGETWLGGITDPGLRAAQIEVCDGAKIIQGFDTDTLDASFRSDPAGHFNDKGAAIVAAGFVAKIPSPPAKSR